MPGIATQRDASRHWTIDDLTAIPDEDPFRYEIADGALEVSPRSRRRHTQVATRVALAIQGQLPEGFMAAREGFVAYGQTWRSPDVLVVPDEISAGDADDYDGNEVLLAVEVESPDSRTRDRITKPHEYAAARIPAYLRVDPDARTITVYILDPGETVYRIAGVHGITDTARITTHFNLTIEVARLFA